MSNRRFGFLAYYMTYQFLETKTSDPMGQLAKDLDAIQSMRDRKINSDKEIRKMTNGLHKDVYGKA